MNTNIIKLIKKYEKKLPKDENWKYGGRGVYNIFLHAPAKALPPEVNRFKVKEILGYGWDCVAIELEDGNVLKIGKKAPAKLRQFDLPFTESGIVGICPCSGEEVHYVIQPKVDKSVTLDEMFKFSKKIKKQGFEVVDFNTNNFRYYKNEIKVIDYEAVQ